MFGILLRLPGGGHVANLVSKKELRRDVANLD
jgi:hypothetical protein